jgi:hypothetical protein
MMERVGWRHPDDFPANLYHYTTASALLKIVESGELWFTDYRHLNDLSEFKYGSDLFVAELLSREERQNDSAIRTLLIEMRKRFTLAQLYTDVYVFCMCADDNLLNQWRVYGRNNLAVSIALHMTGFLRLDWKPYSFEIVPMVYNDSLQRKIVIGAVSAALEYADAVRSKVFESDLGAEAFVDELVSACVGWCLSLKHPQFEVEREWRLAALWGLEHRVLTGRKHRSATTGIVPYLTIRPKEHNVLPIRGITIGPCERPEIHKRTVRDFLFQHGYAGVDVSSSDLPIRLFEAS